MDNHYGETNRPGTGYRHGEKTGHVTTTAASDTIVNLSPGLRARHTATAFNQFKQEGGSLSLLAAMQKALSTQEIHNIARHGSALSICLTLDAAAYTGDAKLCEQVWRVIDEFGDIPQILQSEGEGHLHMLANAASVIQDPMLKAKFMVQAMESGRISKLGWVAANDAHS